ncbi:MAG: DUF2190 domain-containing protein [Thermodesulfobacteriota bacterium]
MTIGVTAGIEKAAKCTAAIATQYLIAKFGADDNTLSQAAASTDELVGVFQHVTAAADATARIMFTGITNVKLGGTVARGDNCTSDAAGKGVKAAPATGVNANIVGKFLASGVDGDIVPMLLGPGVMQGA